MIELRSYFGQYADDQSYLSSIEFNRGGNATSLIISSPHGGFLGANLTLKKSSNNETLSTILTELPVAGCYNDTVKQCVYTLKDCLKSSNKTISYHADARCVIDRSSTLSMYLLTRSIAKAFVSNHHPFTILNKLTRQYVDPAENLLLGTFLLESAIRVYFDYHRLIAMAKEAIRSPSRGLFIEFIFHRHSQTVQLGYGFDPFSSSRLSKPLESTMRELISRSGPSVIIGNSSLAYFLRLNGFDYVIPMEQSQQQRQIRYLLSTYSTRMHADQRFNAILFSYPIERLRKHSIEKEAKRIAKAIEQFIQTNNIKILSSFASPSLSANRIVWLFLLFLSQCCTILYNYH
ncbi:unnamed protein product [Rotaria socialis]|uniref:Uncharacterized protein n=1 Tax=Rotaria socialis TaxID=392032 RepID=A0A820SFG9_9BILA|nr:unnamed protein product [Rotaria socialis]CAF3429118.1 unnamed protein product [Rotaria socialis]CAF3485715.1 unnamed protein product [Rotaria socialis]CAF3640921.1 unnamed protein product [Rotaria socialis]CAF3642538.1 unnamed protein product [Rotaria socialis]